MARHTLSFVRPSTTRAFDRSKARPRARLVRLESVMRDDGARAAPFSTPFEAVRTTLSRVANRANGALASASASTARRARDGASARRRPVRRVADVARATKEEKGSADAGAAKGGKFTADGADVESMDDDKPLLICAFDVVGATPEQEAQIREVMTLKSNYSYRAREVAAECKVIQSIGIYKEVRARAKDTRDGLRVTFEVVPFETLRGVELHGLESVPVTIVEEAFRPMFGKPINHNELLQTLDSFRVYLSQQKGATPFEDCRMIEDTSDGVLRLGFIDAVVDEVKIDIEPSIDAKTGKENKVMSKIESVLPYFESIKNAKTLNAYRVREALDRFKAQNPRFGDPQVSLAMPQRGGAAINKRTLMLSLREKSMKGVTCGGGMSARGLSEGIFSGVAGHFSAFHTNLFGEGKMLNLGVEATPRKGGRGLTVVRPQANVQYQDPWVGFGPTRTSRVMSVRSEDSSVRSTHGVGASNVDGGQPDITSPGLSEMSLQRLGTGIEHSRPLLNGWNGTFSIDFKRNSLLDNDGNHSLFDAYGAPVTFSGTKHDTALSSHLRFTYSGSNAAQLMLSAEQAFPLQPQWLNYTRMIAKAKRSFNLLSIDPLPGPVQLVLSSKGGSVIGDLPPCEAFAIGGTTSVRGYNDGAIGTGRKYVVGSAEARVPITPMFTAAAFFDYGSDLHSGSSVLGDPAGTRGKPGSGYSYGVAGMLETGGLPIRIDYARNDQGNARFHFSLARDFN